MRFLLSLAPAIGSFSLTRNRWAYSADAVYEAATMPDRGIAEAPVVAGAVGFSIDGPGSFARAAVKLDGRAGELLTPCDPDPRSPGLRRLDFQSPEH